MTIARVITVVAFALLLSGCATTPTPAASTPTVIATPTPTPTPTPRISTIALNAESAAAFDQNGQLLATLDYYASPVDVVAQLNDLFGFAPVIEVVDPIASDGAFSGTKYDWEGFELRWYGGYEDDPNSGWGAGTYPTSPRLDIIATVSSVRGVIVQAPDGVRVGDGQGDLATRYPDETIRYEVEGRLVAVASVSCIEHPEISEEARNGVPRNCVAVWADPAEGSVTRIWVPAKVDYGL